MPVITRRIELEASAAATFDYIASHENVPDWMFGVTSFVPVVPVTRGVGDRFDAEMSLGPKVLRSSVEVVEWVESAESTSVVALSSVDGFDTSSRWSVTPVDDGRCSAHVEFRYSFPGGLAGRAVATIVQPFIDQGIGATERTLRQRLESHSTA